MVVSQTIELFFTLTWDFACHLHSGNVLCHNYSQGQKKVPSIIQDNSHIDFLSGQVTFHVHLNWLMGKNPRPASHLPTKSYRNLNKAKHATVLGKQNLRIWELLVQRTSWISIFFFKSWEYVNFGSEIGLEVHTVWLYMLST